MIRSTKFEEIRDVTAPDGLDACLPLGSKLGLDQLQVTTGGGATNAAVTFSRLGLKAACITRVGQDLAGEEVARELKRERVAANFVQIDDELHTATSIIFVAGTGHRAILTFRGAANALSAKQIPWNKLNSRWFYITGLGGNLKLIGQIMDAAKKCGAKVAWNPGNGELVLGLKKLAPLLKQTAVLIMNREEAAALTNLPPRHLHDIIKKLKPFGLDVLAITDGQRGAYLQADNKTVFTPALKGKRVNTTGAGDAFGSGLVAALTKEYDISDALKVAMLNATSVVCHMGAKAGILHKIPARIELAKVKINQI